MLLDNITERTLDNGLKIIVLRKPGAPVVATQLWYKTGSIGERDGIRGISHMLEHMMFRGSAAVRSEEHARKINDIGGHCNAFTTEDMTVYVNSVPRDFCEMVFELEADRMDRLSLDPDLFETERKVIIEEYHTYMNNPVAKAFMEFRQEFFRNHPYSTSPLGVITDLETMTTGQLRDYYLTWYRPDNAVLVVVGDISEKAVVGYFEHHFGKKRLVHPQEGPTELPPVEDHRSDPSVNRMKRVVEFDVPLLIIGYPAPSARSVDAVAMEILQLVIAGGESSRLHREVVRRQSAAVMVGGMNHMLKYAGMSMFFAAFTPDIPVGRVEQALEKQIERVRRDGILPEEMEKVKHATLTSRTFELYSTENICHRLGYSECVEGDYRMWVKRLEALRQLDSDRLVEVARSHWDDRHRHVLHLQPRKTNPLLYVAGFLRRLRGGRK
ncbi:MAG: insulinase family protein [Chitinispirillaceae bacterium]|nr:insulinase family protein [Chitinispirillaceae bacterium]